MELRTKAVLATLYALAGMLVYIAFRFEWIYGLGAVIAVFHDTLITIGLFSIFHEEISMTVIAALLTLVGYSMNDTIVIFDRIRENLKIMRREPLESVMNKSVNQTLSRTIMTVGSDVPDGDRAVYLGWSGTARVLVRAGLRYHCWNVFFGVYRQSDRFVLAQLYGQSQEDCPGGRSRLVRRRCGRARRGQSNRNFAAGHFRAAPRSQKERELCMFEQTFVEGKTKKTWTALGRLHRSNRPDHRRRHPADDLLRRASEDHACRVFWWRLRLRLLHLPRLRRQLP